MRRCSAALCLAALLGLALTGCVHLERHVQLKSDGSGTYTLTIGISDRSLAAAGAQEAQTIAQTMQQFIAEHGGEVRRSDADGYSIWAITRQFASVAELNAILPELPAPPGSSPSDKAAIQISERTGFFSTTFHATGRLELAPITTTDPTQRALLQEARESFALSLPGWVSAQTGGEQSGTTVTYTVRPGEHVDIAVTGGGLTTGGALTLGGVLLLVSVAGALGARRLRRSSRARRAAGSMRYCGACGNLLDRASRAAGSCNLCGAALAAMDAGMDPGMDPRAAPEPPSHWGSGPDAPTRPDAPGRR